ncbi:MAG: hypothetical protein IIY21_22695 [Clostridiales bacterium]|nr:hypothetical protein [Clostridiales bacterium]
MSRRFNEPWTREDYEDMVIDMVQERLEDDALYPQIYLEQIARHDPRLFDGFVRDVLDDMGATVLKECEQYGGLTRAEIEQAILKVIKAAADEWEQMTPEEQKECFDIEEIDKARAEAISRNEQRKGAEPCTQFM